MSYFSWTYSRLAPLFEVVMAPLRARQTDAAYGRVLVLGAGTGLGVDALERRGLSPDLLEPDPRLAQHLRERYPELRVMECGAEHIPAEPASYDTVISTLVMCSVDSVQDVLGEVHRVLKPGGQFLMTEHVGHEEGVGRAAQHLLEPLWKPLAGGCRLTRTPTDLQSNPELVAAQWDEVRHGLLLPIIQGQLLKR